MTNRTVFIAFIAPLEKYKVVKHGKNVRRISCRTVIQVQIVFIINIKQKNITEINIVILLRL